VAPSEKRDSPGIEIHIDRLVLPAALGGAGPDIGLGLRRELQRLFSAASAQTELGNLPARERTEVDIPALRLGIPEMTGRQIAGAVYRGLTG
jgi:hypothetical protein